MRTSSRQGFTLLELAVVITIIAIVAGGVFVAQTLIRSSHLNRILAEYDTILKAYNEFYDKYHAYPGDMNKAESYWGSDATCPNTPTNLVRKILTCNGDGDGKIGESTTGGVLSDSREWFRAWQHMGNARFMNAQFTGVPGAGGVMHGVPTYNIPETADKGSGWTLFYLQNIADTASLWAGEYGHVVTIGHDDTSGMAIQPFLSGEEARSVDAKVDDGRPGTGFIRAWRNSVLPGCSNSDVSAAAQNYDASSDAHLCSLFFITGN